MGRIRILSDVVANQIAAGEVVERPASVVKELLENSLDAGATDIRIDVEGGGKRLLRITDNGSGMLRDDALLAFERHATSKLKEADDLLAISTLGFRGEALPSIASVSRLMLETRTKEETTGTTVEIAGGKIVRCDESALAGGTIITVRDLFFNVPARRKFLRSEQTELAHIGSLATHYSLAHPDKSFQLRHGANELLSVNPVADMRERVYQVFGAQVLDELTDLGYSERALPTGQGGVDEEPYERMFSLRGFVSRPQVQKLNRNSIYLFVNGRLIRDKLLLHALSSAYHNLMPPACYPFALVFLDCASEEVDVNVHPSKTEVRFRHGSFVHDFVRDTVRLVLMKGRPVSIAPMPVSPQAAAELPYSEFSQTIENAPPEESFPQNDTEEEQQHLPEFHLRSASPPPLPGRFDFQQAAETPVSATPWKLPVPATHQGFPSDVPVDATSTMHDLSDLRPLGQLHNSFIIAAGRDGLWIVDQHVAHERILFEQVLKARGAGTVEQQQLLMPVVLELTPSQQLQYARIADEMNSIGFDTEPFGNRTIAVKAAPSGIGAAELEKVIFEILEIGESEMRSLSLGDIRRGIAASLACQAAIKINTRLDQSKMEWLLNALSATDYPMACPHGRPIALRYSIKDILRSFHRI